MTGSCISFGSSELAFTSEIGENKIYDMSVLLKTPLYLSCLGSAAGG